MYKGRSTFFMCYILYTLNLQIRHCIFLITRLGVYLLSEFNCRSGVDMRVHLFKTGVSIISHAYMQWVWVDIIFNAFALQAKAHIQHLVFIQGVAFIVPLEQLTPSV